MMIAAAAYGHLGRPIDAKAALALLPAGWSSEFWIDALPDPTDRDYLRSGLALAEAGA